MPLKKLNTWEFRCDTDQVVCHEFRFYTVPERQTAIDFVRGVGWQWFGSSAYCHKHHVETRQLRTSDLDVWIGA
jgi:hypothetical protein